MKRYLEVIILFSLFIFLQGCGASITELNNNHISTTFNPMLIEEKNWAVDSESLMPTRFIEIYPYGGNKGGAGLGAANPMEGDFYVVFEKNSNELMKSLFGPRKNDNDDGNIITLYIDIANVHSKSSWNSLFEIEMNFTLKEESADGEKIIAKCVAKGSHSSYTGTSLNFHVTAHERANVAINNAFGNAQKELYKQLR